MHLCRSGLGSILMTVVVLAAAMPGYAASPKLSVNCSTPNGRAVMCRLHGTGFHAGERVRITYRVQFTSLPRVRGKLQEKVFRREARTSSAGAFTRPPLSFAVVKYHESFRLTVTAAGERGDRTTTTYVAIAQ